MIYKCLFPGGKPKALTLSYDDGVSSDRRLIALMREYGIRGTFNVNAGLMNGSGSERRDGTFVYRMKPDEYGVYEGFELAVHGYSHPDLAQMPPDLVTDEIINDRRGIERMTGQPVRGMAYPYGSYDERLVAQLRQLGVAYSRTTRATSDFSLPGDFLTWHPTCHHKAANLQELADRFLAERNRRGPRVFYLWGHSYEFHEDGNWPVIEDFFRKMAFRDEIWYATNMEIYEYVQALNRLSFSVDGDLVSNPSAMDVWIQRDGESKRIAGGTTGKI